MADDIQRHQTIRLYGTAESVVEIEDNAEGMDLCGIAFGSFEEGKAAFPSGQALMDWDMARAVARELNRLADEHSPSTPDTGRK
jgi:hypothetical protein